MNMPLFKSMGNSLTHTVSSACEWLISQQKPDGHWVGPVGSNASMEAEWCLAPVSYTHLTLPTICSV